MLRLLNGLFISIIIIIAELDSSINILAFIVLHCSEMRLMKMVVYI